MVWILENVAQKLDLKTEILLIIPSTCVLQFHTPPPCLWFGRVVSPPPSTRGLHPSCFPLHLDVANGHENDAQSWTQNPMKAILFSLTVLTGGSHF